MKKILLLLLVCSTAFVSAQEVISAEVQTPTFAAVLNIVLPINVTYNVKNYKITYTTVDALGQPDTATGLLCVPDNNDFVWPLVIYNHGTIASRDLAPSVEGVLERILIQGFSASGFIALAPDYLGLGGSDGPHPYLHADSEASAGKDMIIAVKKWLDAENIRENDQLFITGYSQGGHASAALHQRLEMDTDGELQVTAAAHLSAPFDISPPSPLLLGLTNVPPVSLSFFTHTLISYNSVYGLYGNGSADSLFVEPYLTEVNRFLTEEIDLYEMGNELDALLRENSHVAGQMFVEQFVEDVLDADPALFNAYNANDVFDWAPQSPTLIYYCNADETVNPANSILADATMRANGATGIVLEDGGALNHGDCAVPAAVRALMFFQAEANTYPVSLGTPASRPELKLVPNPVAAGHAIQVQGLSATPRPYVIYDISGRRVLDGSTTSSGNINLPEALPKGWNVLRVGLEDGTSVVRRFLVQ
ncbi:T9SS type A sorting domain-containing protein [Neolewinella persica]|uniref:T9SS type A sorting domain-containing protein n=1 Tax=Neolewinella persica TaxID=70998 RepID=UPI00037EFA6F|nr:T9SS type A sorting domain-containing protein [Neolewinella persica]